MRDLSLVFLARAGCHLCDDARPLVGWAADRAGVPVVEVDIDTDDRLTALYGLRIPVLLAFGDRVVAEGIIDDRRAVLRKLRQLRRS